MRTATNTQKTEGMRQAFSLITVLIAMMAGFALVGAAFYVYSSFVERSIRSLYLIEEENLIDEGIERGRLAFDKWIDENGGGLPEAVFKKRPEEMRRISGIEDLLIAPPASEEDTPWSLPELDYTVDISGAKTVSIKVEIFDIDYTADQLDYDLGSGTKAGDAARAQLPPGIPGEGNYLIRSTMRLHGKSGGIVAEMAFSRLR